MRKKTPKYIATAPPILVRVLELAERSVEHWKREIRDWHRRQRKLGRE
jgi:hypothetical protein